MVAGAVRTAQALATKPHRESERNNVPTQIMSKDQERIYVEHIAPALEWAIVEERERPDFIVREGQQQFGLELIEAFNGPSRKKGSILKAAEATRQKRISNYQRRYTERGGPALSVKILGDPGEVELDQLIEKLQRCDFESLSIGEKLTIRVGEQTKVFATKALRPHWYSVDDTVGWVNPNASSILQCAIAKKAEQIDEYRNAVGSDVRLLAVANHLRTSGMLTLESGTNINTCGFHTVYFLPYPEDVHILR